MDDDDSSSSGVAVCVDELSEDDAPPSHPGEEARTAPPDLVTVEVDGEAITFQASPQLDDANWLRRSSRPNTSVASRPGRDYPMGGGAPIGSAPISLGKPNGEASTSGDGGGGGGGGSGSDSGGGVC